MKLPLVSAFLFSCAGMTTSAPQPSSVDRIELVQRFTGFVCAGVCVDQRVVVSADGHVSWQINPLSRRPSKLLHFLVKPSAAAEYIREMNAVRPGADLTDRTGCNADGHARNKSDWNIEWVGAGRPIRLRSCDEDRRVALAWRAALKALGMPYGIAEPIGSDVKELTN